MAVKQRILEDEGNYWNAIREAANCLAEGGLVVFPTETVYGVGANATDPDAVTRLRELKNRPPDKPFTVHIGNRSAIDRFVPRLDGVGRRLIEKAWPGPLTVIFPVDPVDQAPVIRETSTEHASAMYSDGTIGVRCPDDRGAADLLTGTRFPVIAASANPAGAPPPLDAEEAMAGLGSGVDLVLDGGRTRYNKPSTIVQIEGQEVRLIREGVLDQRTVQRLTTVNVLMVCSGNTCRSPMAEALMRRMLADRMQCPEEELPDRGYHVESAGTGAMFGAQASPGAVAAMRARGIDIAGHRSTPLTVEQVNRADVVLTMTGAHAETVRAMAPHAQERVHRIDDTDITDPVGGGDDEYGRCAERIEQALQRRLKEMTL